MQVVFKHNAMEQKTKIEVRCMTIKYSFNNTFQGTKLGMEMIWEMIWEVSFPKAIHMLG